MRIRLFLLLPLLLLSCDHSTGLEDAFVLPAIDVPWTAEQSLVCFGTSLTAGFMWEEVTVQPKKTDAPRFPKAPYRIAQTSETDTTSYPALLRKLLRITVHNEGYVGANTLYALSRVDTVLARNPALVLLEFGANDFLQNISDSLTEIRLGRLIDTLQIAGSKVVLVSFIHEEMITNLPPDHYFALREPLAYAYLAMLRRVAHEKGVLFVEYAMKGIYWNNDLLSDGMHPNRPGYKLMMENIYQALQRTFERNGMMK